jgi:hypothetical protein
MKQIWSISEVTNVDVSKAFQMQHIKVHHLAVDFVVSSLS